MGKPPISEEKVDRLRAAARRLCQEVETLRFAPPVAHVYNPLRYARKSHELYLSRFGSGPKRVLFLGMNPGPFGMAQTGVPFGEICAVRDWMGIKAPVERPHGEHPLRPVLGFDCARTEVSGERLWGLFASRFGSPEKFFARHFVANYCPLAFLEETGRNRTPDKLSPGESQKLFAACDRHFLEVVELLEPEWVVGIGAFAANRARQTLCDLPVRIGQILHPSPANPAANGNWAAIATEQLVEQKVWKKSRK
jgi:single-strand selective monofunctional uracil DNA glycosylase